MTQLEQPASSSDPGARRISRLSPTLNADPRVMEHFPGTLDRAASDALAADIQAI